jgi:hypothetical protein
MNNNNNNYPGQVEQMAAQAASNILEVKPAIPAQAAPRRAAPGQSRAASPRSARPGPGSARRSAQTAPAREVQGAQGSAPVRERRAGFDWGKLAGRAGYAPPHIRFISGVGGLGMWLVSGYITAESLGKDTLLSWAVVIMFTIVEMVIWYLFGVWWVVIPALALMSVDVWLNIGAFHVAYNYNYNPKLNTWSFDYKSSKSWLYALLGFVFATFPEPLIKLAFTGRLVESRR